MSETGKDFTRVVGVGLALPGTCGRFGCLSTVSAAWAIIARVAHIHGADLTIHRLLALAADGDPHVIEALEVAGGHLGRVLTGLVGALNPSLLVLSGNVGAHSQDFLHATAKSLTVGMMPTTAKAITLVHATLGDRSELHGAGARVLRDDRRVRAFMAGA